MTIPRQKRPKPQPVKPSQSPQTTTENPKQPETPEKQPVEASMTSLQGEGAEMDETALSGPENGSGDDPDFDLSHMETFRAPELETESGGADDVVQVDQDGAPLNVDQAVEQMSKDAFYVVFRTAFQAPSFVSLDFQPLAIQPGEESTAREASNATYELLEIYYPKALMPGGDNFARLMVAGSFIAGKIVLLRMILMERRRARMAPPPEARRPVPEARAANTDAPPAEGLVDPTAWAQNEREPVAA